MARLRGKARARAARVAAWLRNEKVVTPDPEVQLAHDLHQQALRQASRHPDEIIEQPIYPVVCSDHLGPPWRPAPITPGGPQPPKGLCPHCNGPREKNEGQVVYMDSTGPVKATTPEQEDLFEAWKERERAKGHYFPGDPQHDDAVRRADEDRVSAIEYDTTPKGLHGTKVVYSNPFTGITIRRPRKRRRQGYGQMPLWTGDGTSSSIIVTSD